MGFFRKTIQVYFNRKMAVVTLLGFSAGIPFALIGGTLQAWMTERKVSLETIGLFSLVGLPFTFKFVWSPLMDRFRLPILGRRRGWILLCQFVLMLSIWAIGASNMGDSVSALRRTAILALIVAFASASQDIVIDAYRAEYVTAAELGPSAASYITGYRIAMIISGSVALILADHMPWKWVYSMMALCMGIGLIGTFVSEEPVLQVKPPVTLREAVTEPLFEFFKRKGAFEILAFVLLYKLDVVVASALMTPFMLQMGFTKTDIGTVYKFFGIVATIIGTLIGGGISVGLGLRRSLWIFGLAQGISGLAFALLAHLGNNYPVMVAAIGIENICNGCGNAAFMAFVMSACDKRYTATQYALLTSVMALSRVFAGAPTGYLASSLGWTNYFIFSVFIMIPGLLILTRFPKWAIATASEA